MDKNQTPTLMFFVGTTAELIKVFTIIDKCIECNTPFKIIASGQNNFQTTDIMNALSRKVDLALSSENDIRKNAIGLFSWYFRTKKTAAQKIVKAFPDVDFARSIMIVHGDTISTMMGAKIGKALGMKVAHVEAGLRSGSWFSPFPEEFDRVITSKTADIHFCPGEKPLSNLNGVAGLKINTHCNTIVDGLNYSRKMPCRDKNIDALSHMPHCVFVMHRQENLLKPSLVKSVVNEAIETAKTMTVIFILHKITEDTLNRMRLLKTLESTPNVVTLRRVEYFDFMKLLESSCFVITDGGSNQEELSYMGKPALILRNHTERNDGLDKNVMMFAGDTEKINWFAQNYKTFEYDPVCPTRSPTDIIYETLTHQLPSA